MYAMNNRCKKEKKMQNMIRKRNIVIQEKIRNKSTIQKKSKKQRVSINIKASSYLIMSRLHIYFIHLIINKVCTCYTYSQNIRHFCYGLIAILQETTVVQCTSSTINGVHMQHKFIYLKNTTIILAEFC